MHFVLSHCFLHSFCSEAHNSSNSLAFTWQEHVTLIWLYLLLTKFGIKSVCVCVGGGCVYSMCFAKKPKWGHFLPVINQGLDNLSLNLSYLLLSILSLSLFSQGRVENALSSEIHFAFRQFASFHVIVLLLWVCFLPKRNSSSKPWSPIVSVLIG